MQEKCKNHPEKQALSLCHNCSNYFCSDCLVEGSEYYYCKSPDCIKAYEQNEIVNNVKKEYKERKGDAVYEAMIPEGPPPVPNSATGSN